MNVLLLTPAFTCQSGGVQAHARHLATHLPHLPGVKNVEIIELLPPTSCVGRYRERIRTSFQSLKALNPSFDLCWATHLDLSPLARLAQIKGGPSYILSCHGIELQKKLPLHKKWGLKGASTIAAVSRWTQSLLINQHKIQPDKAQVFPNTFTPPKEIPERSAARDFLKERFPLSPGPVFFYLGRLRPEDREKGYGRVLEVIALLKKEKMPANFIAAGSGPDHDWLAYRAAELGVSNQFFCPGRIPENELPLYYAGADLFTMPSTKEGFGIVFLEALSHGTPVLAGNRDGSREPLMDGQLGLLCDPTDIRAMTNQLVDFLKNPEHPLKDAANLIHSVNKEFGPDAYRQRLGQIISAISKA